jgi:hypothetical protein
MQQTNVLSELAIDSILNLPETISAKEEKLYNVLLKEYSIMSVNGLTVETLNPCNIAAKIYTGDFTTEQKCEIIAQVNKTHTKRHNQFLEKRQIKRMPF